jgi:HEAT repeat protein
MKMCQWRNRFWLALLNASFWLVLSGSGQTAGVPPRNNAREPSYLGKSVGYWLERFNWPETLTETNHPEEAFRKMGEETLPHIMRNLLHTQEMAGAACLALRALGEKTSELALPTVKPLFEEGDWRGEMALLCIGKKAEYVLEECCASSNSQVRVSAALTLSRLVGKQPRDAIAIGYRKTATHDSIVVLGHFIATEDIWNLGRQLKHPNALVRRATADALVRYSAKARLVRRNLLEALKDTDLEVVAAAQAALSAQESDKEKESPP